MIFSYGYLLNGIKFWEIVGKLKQQKNVL